jgi:WD40 repeat protein
MKRAWLASVIWDAAAGTLVHTFAGHTSDVISVAFSPDGRRVLSHTYDNTIKVWDAATGALVHTFEGHSDQILVVASSPDGSRVLSASATTIKLWDAATGAPLQTFETHPKVMIPPPPTVGPPRKGSSPRLGDRTYSYWNNKWVAFSPDGSRIGSRGANKHNEAVGLGHWPDTAHRSKASTTTILKRSTSKPGTPM